MKVAYTRPMVKDGIEAKIAIRDDDPKLIGCGHRVPIVLHAQILAPLVLLTPVSAAAEGRRLDAEVIR
jgi:hypothetical protein